MDDKLAYYLLEQCTPAQRGLVVRRLFDEAKRGSVIELPPATYDFGSECLKFPDFVTVRGSGRDTTIFSSTGIFILGTACCFELGQRSVVEDLRVQSQCLMNQQSLVIGYGIEIATPRSAIMRRVSVLGRAWGVYLWTAPDGNKLEMFDCDITAGRVCVAACRSSGENAQFVDMHNCKLIGQPNLTNQGGAVSHPEYGGVLGIANRGGRLRAWDCEIQLQGHQSLKRVVGITNWFDSGSSRSLVEVYNLHCRLTPGHSEQECYDFDSRMNGARIMVSGGTGTGNLGRYLVEPTNPVIYMQGQPT